MATKKDDNSFHVKLGGIKLTEASKQRIEAGIQSVVLKELAEYKPNPDDSGTSGGGVIHIPPRIWRGFIAMYLTPKELESIQGLKELEQLF